MFGNFAYLGVVFKQIFFSIVLNCAYCIRNRKDTQIVCTTTSVNSPATGNIVVIFDDQTVQPDTAIEFTYRENPTFTSIQPQLTILK